MSDISKLLEIMARLRDPAGGCPWDLEQDFASIAPYTIEEAYEVAEAIQRQDMGELKDELGDLLFQVVFHARLAEERQAFAFGQVVQAICDKLVRRHPHVFAGHRVDSAAAQSEAWEAHKAREKQARGAGAGVLADIPVALPALARAAKLGRRASRAGFDWPDASGPQEKILEELEELAGAVKGQQGPDRLRHELGDLLFAVVNLSRHLDIDPERALREANGRFQQRFEYVERALAEQGKSPDQADLASMDRLWEQAKEAGL